MNKNAQGSLNFSNITYLLFQFIEIAGLDCNVPGSMMAPSSSIL